MHNMSDESSWMGGFAFAHWGLGLLFFIVVILALVYLFKSLFKR